MEATINVVLFCLVCSGLNSGTTADDGFGNDLWRSKFKTYSATLDHDRDGFLTYAEVQANNDAYMKLYRGNDPNAPKNFVKGMNDLWDAMSGTVPSGTEVSYEQTADGMLAAGQDKCESILGAVSPIYFQFGDTNGDGKVDVTEMEVLYNTFLLINPNDIAEAFKAIDTDADGYITKSQHVKSIVDFFCTGEHHPADVAWGPLQD